MASFLVPRLRSSGQNVQVFGSPSARLPALKGSDASGAVSDPDRIGFHQTWLVLCKTWQNQAKVEALRRVAAPASILVLQNGLEPETDWTPLSSGVERGLTTYGVASVSPGQVVGGDCGQISVPAGSAWAAIFEAADLQVREARDMRSAIWWKLIINASLNVVAAVGDLRNGEVLQRPALLRWASWAAEEVGGFAQALGVDLGPGDPVWGMQRVARSTADNVCSTLADLRSGRPTEYESINGALIRLAHERGWRLPILEELDREFRLVASRHLQAA